MDVYVDKVLQLPVTPVNFPYGVELKTFPTKVGVAFQIGSDDMRRLQDKDFGVVLDYRTLDLKSEKADVSLQYVPDYVRNARLLQPQVDYLLEWALDLTSLLGDDTYLPDGSLNKAKMSAMLFADSAVRDAVNAIVHPAVIADFLGWCGSRSGEDLLFVESAILIESGLLASVDTSIMVTAAPDVRLARIIARDRIDRQQALARMGSQMDDAAKAALCDHIVSNNPGDRLVPQLLGILKSITGKPVK